MARLILLLLLTLSTNTYASLDMNLLKSLLQSGQALKAFSYASDEMADYEGTPEFDYYYAIAAIDSGHASEGVFALERVLLMDAGNYAARLELARGYFVLEEYARSRQEFETVLTADPPEEVVNSVQLYLDAIVTQEGRYKTTQTGFVEFGLGSDSNANSGPDIVSYDIGPFKVPLDINSRELDDSFNDLKLGYKVSTPVSPGVSYFLALNAGFHENSDNSQFDTRTYTVGTGFKFLEGESAFTLDLLLQQFELDGNSYQSLTGLNSSWLHNLTEQSAVQVYLQLSKIDYDLLTTPDANTISLGSSYSTKLSAKFSPVLIAGLYMAQDDPKLNTAAARESTERDYYGIQLATILGLSNSVSVKLSLRYQDTQYKVANALIGKRRQDDLFSTSLDVVWRLARRWQLLPKINIVKSNSNIELYEYDRTLYSVNLRYSVK